MSFYLFFQLTPKNVPPAKIVVVEAGFTFGSMFVGGGR